MSLKAQARLRSLAGLFSLAIVGSAVRPVSADDLPPADVPPFDALYEIRDACSACSDALRITMDRAKARDESFWTSLSTARSSATLAFSLSRGADWPRSLYAYRRKIERRIVRTGNQLSMLEVMATSNASRRVHIAVRQQLPRVESANALLAMLLEAPEVPPDAPPSPPLPPAPAPTPAPPGTIPTLVPGEGFTAATPQPDIVGTGPGADAKAIARWDVVPYQTVATKIPVGVVAFHIAGIEAVDFSVNGGPWARVTQMTQNPLTLVWEYSAWVDPATLTDGPVEVRAVVRPKKGIARLLAGPLDEGPAARGRGEHSLFLNANAQGTLPSRTIWADGLAGDDATGDGTAAHPIKTLPEAYKRATDASADVNGLTVYLKPGDYGWPYSWAGFKENAQYVTVAGAPGQDRTAARITIADASHNRGLDARRVCVRNLTVVTSILGNETHGCFIWADGCDFQGGGIDTYAWILQDQIWSLGIWLTKPVIHGMNTATMEYRFMRDYEIYDIGEDSIRDFCGFAINGYVHDMRYGNPTVHSDVIQFYDGLGANGQFENVAIYGLKSRRIGGVGEGVLGLLIRNYSTVPSHRDLAFVNCELEFAGNAQILHSISHLLIWNCDFLPNPVSNTGGSLLLRDDPPDSPATVLHNFSLRNSVVTLFSVSCSTEPLVTSPLGGEAWADGNHVIGGQAVGAHVTSGGTTETLFIDPANGNYEPSAASPLLGRQGELLLPSDVTGRPRTTPDAAGAEAAPAAK
jgi:hypothetical protein